MHLTVPATQD